MKLFGFELVLRKKAVPQNLQSVTSQSWFNSWFGGWVGRIQEPFTGAWQRNITIDSQTTLLAFSAVFACVTGIAADIAKLRIKLDTIKDGIWEEITDPHGNARESQLISLLKKPNHYQSRIKFIEQWIISKLLHGNAYVLKERETRDGPVRAMYVLDPTRVTVKVAPDGSVWYEIRKDELSQVEDDTVTVPASEIIHDMMVSLWHPLIGVSPIYACGLSATMGNKIQTNSTSLFGNLSRPGGVVMFPGTVTKEQAEAFKERWESNFGGANMGRTAILDNGSKFEPIAIPAEAAQLIEQLRWTVEDVARAFHYPQYKLGGPMPPYSTGPETLTLMYFTDCLQPLIESLEVCLDDGLGLPSSMGTELDLDNLLRMDTASLYDSNGKAVGGGWMSPDEARFRANLAPVPGGSSPMIQQQNWTLEQLSRRTAPSDGAAAVVPAAPPATPAAQRSWCDDDLDAHTEVALRREYCLQP